MQYALIDGARCQAIKGAEAICSCCGRTVIAKCGKVIIHHWAHKRSKDCDSWHEPETEWHREWKNKFPESFREISMRDNSSAEIHRADIQTKNGVIIEFQNSPISIDEAKSRDTFYKKRIWVINGLPFQDNFSLFTQIPNPSNPKLDSFLFMNGTKHLLFCEKDDYSGKGEMVEIFGMNNSRLSNIVGSKDCFIFGWKRPRTVWYETQSPVFIDFGNEYLFWLKKRIQINGAFHYIQKVRKSDFLNKYSSD